VIILWLWVVGVWFAEFAKQKKREKNSWIPFSSGCEVFLSLVLQFCHFIHFADQEKYTTQRGN
jgi:hypothetical protein